ncbi:PREDICTED: cytochrome c oxidase assembly factor 4 homolog, mitochondrial [Dufourea novaeangliae]|nr:PREDICTED: cytochrome c oxidase assembly factor 4 homolog, mitochondrial [Dufourea novaeangliae]
MKVNSSITVQQQDVVDPLEEMLKKTGCMELHYQVQECIAETQDWRKCREQVKQFKVCMDEYQKKREKQYS